MSHWLISPRTSRLKTSFHRKIRFRTATGSPHSIEFEYTSIRQIKMTETSPVIFIWRRERDSNSRWNFRPTNDLANRPLQPLGYLSICIENFINCTLYREKIEELDVKFYKLMYNNAYGRV